MGGSEAKRQAEIVKLLLDAIESLIASFVNAVIQADEQGISILETLKEQAGQLR